MPSLPDFENRLDALLEEIQDRPVQVTNGWEHLILCLFSFLGALMLFGTQVFLNGHH